MYYVPIYLTTTVVNLLNHVENRVETMKKIKYCKYLKISNSMLKKIKSLHKFLEGFILKNVVKSC